MTVASPDFLVLAFRAVAAVHLLSGRMPRDVILLAFSLVFVALALDPISLAGLALFVATGFGLCRIVGIWRRPGWALLAVASTVLLFWLLGEDDVALLAGYRPGPVVLKIGRASCRERVCPYV